MKLYYTWFCFRFQNILRAYMTNWFSNVVPIEPDRTCNRFQECINKGLNISFEYSFNTPNCENLFFLPSVYSVLESCSKTRTGLYVTKWEKKERGLLLILYEGIVVFFLLLFFSVQAFSALLLINIPNLRHSMVCKENV